MRAWTRLLLLASTVRSAGYTGRGDFFLGKEGHLTRRAERTVAPFAYAGAAILHPRLFANAPEGAFSLNLLFDEAIAEGRLFGVRLDGLWINVETPGGDRRRRAGDRGQRCVRDMGAPERLYDSAGRAVPPHPGRGAARRPADRRLSPRDPFALADVTLYLPTRRAARAIRESFLDQLGRPLLLPRIRTLGDIDEDDLASDGSTPSSCRPP